MFLNQLELRFWSNQNFGWIRSKGNIVNIILIRLIWHETELHLFACIKYRYTQGKNLSNKPISVSFNAFKPHCNFGRYGRCLHTEKSSDSRSMNWNWMVFTIFLLFLNQMEFSLADNQKEIVSTFIIISIWNSTFCAKKLTFL